MDVIIYPCYDAMLIKRVPAIYRHGTMIIYLCNICPLVLYNNRRYTTLHLSSPNYQVKIQENDDNTICK